MNSDAYIHVRARSTDPDTSHEAAAQLNKEPSRLNKSVKTVVAILSESPFPLSDFQIRDRWDKHWIGSWSFTLPSKARHWAREEGLVKHDGYGRHNGRRVRLWAFGRDDAFLAAPDAAAHSDAWRAQTMKLVDALVAAAFAKARCDVDLEGEVEAHDRKIAAARAALEAWLKGRP